EEAIHYRVPFFGIDLFSEIHRALHVGEEDGHLFALAFKGAARRQDFLGKMFGGVAARIRCRSRLRGIRERLPALTAELYSRSVLEAAARALALQRCAAFAAKLYAARVFEAAGWAAHGRPREAASTHRPARNGDSS